MKKLDHWQHTRIRDPVKDGPAIAPAFDKPLGPQTGKLLRNIGLTHAKGIFQFTDTFFRAVQLAQQRKPRGIRKCTQILASRRGAFSQTQCIGRFNIVNH